MASSRMLEGYCSDIEHLLREGSLREAVKLAVALPEIAAALQSPDARASHEHYVRWCDKWLTLLERGTKPITGARVFRIHALHIPPTEVISTADPRPPALSRFRMRRHARSYRSLGRSRVWQPSHSLEVFQVSLCEALVAAARRWYEESGRADPQVQSNLGKLSVR